MLVAAEVARHDRRIGSPLRTTTAHLDLNRPRLRSGQSGVDDSSLNEQSSAPALASVLNCTVPILNPVESVNDIPE